MIEGSKEWHWQSAQSLCSLIQSKAVTSRRLTQHFIDRIKVLDGPINSVVVRDFERALERADAADRALAAGKSWGVLHGLPMTVKENNDVESLPTTLGNPKRRRIASATSIAVQRLLDAGAIIMGKTNLAYDINDVQSYNEVYGCCSNPHDLSTTPGGSSGGSAAALAAGFTGLEFGGDIGGSIRTPAHCCGVFGHKATFGIIPIGIGDLVVKGPLARAPEDLALALSVLAGGWGNAARGWRLELPRCAKECLSDFRVAIWGDDALCPVDKDVRTAVSSLASGLRACGARVCEASRPAFDAAEVFDLYKQLLAAAENSGLSLEQLEVALKEARESEGDCSDLGKQRRWIVQRHFEWQAAHLKREELRGVWEAFFKDFDVLVTPICCSDAWPHDHSGHVDQPFWKVGERVIPGNGLSTPYHEQVFWSGVTNAAFNPSTAFPVGRSEAGLPIGLQAVGAEYADYTTITFAECLARELPQLCAFRPPDMKAPMSATVSRL